MRDRFDHTHERQLETKPGGDIVVARGLGIVTEPGRRREWPAAEKARIIVESLTPGAVVSQVARRNGLSPQQLSCWRREARELFADDPSRWQRATSVASDANRSQATTHCAAASQAPVTAPAFVPVVVAPAPSGPTPPPKTPPPNGVEAGPRIDTSKAGAIEIVIGTIVVRVSGRVDADALQAVVDIVRRLACS